MFRVDIDNILRQSTNVYETRTRYPNPVIDTGFEHDDFQSDEFRMYSFKIKTCPLTRVHDWTACPYGHIGERARRRDPRQVPYMAVSCRDHRDSGGSCPRGDTCGYAHGVFEYWLHPAKYRTRVCQMGTACTRPTCFFAHKSDELRVIPATSIPMWAHLSVQRQLEDQVRRLSITNAARIYHSSIGHTGYRQGLGMNVHRRLMSNLPNPSLLPLSSSERPPELRSDVLESLRTTRVSRDYHDSHDSDVPNFDWVTDLLAD